MWQRLKLAALMGAGLALFLGGATARAQVLLASSTYSIRDAGAERSFAIARDEIQVLTADRQRRVENIPTQPDAESVLRMAAMRKQAANEEVDLVLYESGRPRNEFTRRFLTRRVLVEASDAANLARLAKDTGSRYAGPSRQSDRFHFFDASGPGGALTLAAALRGRPGVVSAEPLLARQQRKRFMPNDTLFSQQWHLRNTGQNGGTAGMDVNLTNVWDTFRGAGQKIAIVDDGLQTTHTDLFENVDTVNDYDFNGGDSNPDPAVSEDFHGTSCAGVAAGRGNNGRGISGAAPEAKLAGLRLIGGPATDQDEADAMSHSNSILFVKSNSWGPNDDGQTLEGPGVLMLAALRDGVTTGRGGKGTIYAWAAGNGAESEDNANYDGYANSIYTIAIAAVSDQGAKASYSEPGACVVVSAPSSSFNPDRQGITTTDLMGNNGYNFAGAAGELSDTNYTKTFGGTSSAAPLAAGVMALILQAAPNLGWRDMQEILLRSARKNDPGDFDWRTNSAGFRFNHKYGAGLLDARAAVAMAQTWTNLGPRISVSQFQTNLSIAIPDNTAAGVTRAFSFSNQNLRIEHVALIVDITHYNRGDLEISLVSPSAVTSRLAELHGDAGDHFRSWTFTSVRHWGEGANGTWTVKVADRRASYAGTLKYLRIELFGTSTAGNNPPVLNPIGNRSASSGSTISFPVTATDADGNPITLTASNRPAGSAFGATNGVGTFTWPNAGPTGAYSMVFHAADNQGGRDSESVTLTILGAPAGGAAENVWINEIHYDNSGADLNEGLEVAGAAGVVLTNYSLALYDGGAGVPYATIKLAGTIPNESCGYGAVWFASSGMQNGAPDGVALVRGGVTVLQFLGYEGSFMASSGVASGLTAVNLGVSEPGADPAGQSLQLKGSGTNGAQFAWTAPSAASAGKLNAGQTIVPCGSGAAPSLASIGPKSVALSNALTFSVTATDPDGDPIALTVSNKPAAAAFGSTNGAGTFTWNSASPTGAYVVTFYAAGDDGVDSESVTITVSSASSGGPLLWINEFHYDDEGTDANEGVEIAGVAGTALATCSVLLYNGGDGQPYKTTALSGTIDNEGCGYGAVWFAIAGLQNGAPDGIALVQGTNILQTLAYEGAFTGVGGVAVGRSFVNVGVAEAGTETADVSLQLKGSGAAYAHFAWNGPSAASRGSLNPGQAISPCGGSGGPTATVRFAVSQYVFAEEDGSQTVPLNISFPANVTAQIGVSGTAGNGSDFTLASTSIVFTSSGGTQQNVSITFLDDAAEENIETVTLTLGVLSGARTGTPNSVTISLRDNDSFTIMTGNLSLQTSACDSVYGDPPQRLLKGLKPDIVAMQEFVVTNAGGYAEFVANNFGTNFTFFIESDGASCSIPNGIISRWPILAAGEWSDPYVSYRDFAWATIDIPGTNDLHVICVHLEYTDTDSREPEARALTNYIARAGFPASDFLAICGDLNSTGRMAAANVVLQSIVSDARQPADQNGEKDTNVPRNKPYDYILPGANLNARHVPLVVGTNTFAEGLVFDSRLWSSPPPPILATDSSGGGIQHMAVMKRFSIPAAAVAPSVWMNEIHYDNSGADTNEGIEVAGTAGTVLANYALYRYEGSNGKTNGALALSGAIDDETCGYGAVWFLYPSSGLENGPSEGLALVKDGTNVLQFVSYEGSFTASNGPAKGMTAADLGVDEDPAPAVGQSLQLTGTGNRYDQFVWSGPAASSTGRLNSGQSIVCGRSLSDLLSDGQPPTLLPIDNQGVDAGQDLFFGATALATGGDSIELSVSNAPPGSSFDSTDGDGQFSWIAAAPIGVYTMEVYAADEDGVDYAIVRITVADVPVLPDRLVKFDFDDEALGFVVTAETFAAQIAVSDLTAGIGSPSASDGNPLYAARQSAWTGGNYFEFTVQVAAGFSLVPTRFSFDDRRLAGGPANWKLRHLADGFASDVGAGSTHSQFDANEALLSGLVIEGSNTYRLFGTSASLAGAFWHVDNVLLQGTVMDSTQDEDKDGLRDAWELATFGDTDVADAASDFDSDEVTDLDEYRAGTGVKDADSYLAVRSPEAAGFDSIVIRWPSVSNRWYLLDRATDLFSGFSAVTNLSATPPENIYTDSPPFEPVLLYRIGVQ